MFVIQLSASFDLHPLETSKCYFYVFSQEKKKLDTKIMNNSHQRCWNKHAVRNWSHHLQHIFMFIFTKNVYTTYFTSLKVISLGIQNWQDSLRAPKIQKAVYKERKKIVLTLGLISWLCSISVSHSIFVIIVKRIILMCNWQTLSAIQYIMSMACM